MNSFKNRLVVLLGMLSVVAFPSFADTYNMNGTVIGIQPEYRNVKVPVTVQNCRDVEVPIYGKGGQASTGDTILGAIIGGAIGNQFGGGSGKDAATVLGAIVGADTANKNANNRQVITGYRNERQCSNQTVNETQQQLSGYRVTYEILGVQQTASVSRSYSVGDNIPVQVSIGLR